MKMLKKNYIDLYIQQIRSPVKKKHRNNLQNIISFGLNKKLRVCM